MSDTRLKPLFRAEFHANNVKQSRDFAEKSVHGPYYLVSEQKKAQSNSSLTAFSRKKKRVEGKYEESLGLNPSLVDLPDLVFHQDATNTKAFNNNISTDYFFFLTTLASPFIFCSQTQHSSPLAQMSLDVGRVKAGALHLLLLPNQTLLHCCQGSCLGGEHGEHVET